MNVRGWNSIAIALALSGLMSQSVSAQSGQGGGIPWPTRPGEGGQAAATTGSLSIQVKQGTPEGPPIGVIAVAIELHHRGMVIDTISTETDEHGVVVLENLPIAMAVRPLVKVKYQDLDYQIGGGPLDAQHPHQDIEVVCYVASESPPDWSVQSRHVMVAPEGANLRVTEVMMVSNPGHTTWVGVQAGGPKRNTTSFILPSDAKDVQLGRGFHKWCCSTIVGNKLVNHLPLMPETSEMMFSYLVPVQNGSATVEITAPATVESTTIITPTSLQTSTLMGLASVGEQMVGDSKAQVFTASAMPTNGRASISFANLVTATAIPSATGEQPSSSDATSKDGGSPSSGGSFAKIVAAVGGGLILLMAVILVLRRPGARG
jgi:hypothetical protein